MAKDLDLGKLEISVDDIVKQALQEEIKRYLADEIQRQLNSNPDFKGTIFGLRNLAVQAVAKLVTERIK